MALAIFIHFRENVNLNFPTTRGNWGIIVLLIFSTYFRTFQTNLNSFLILFLINDYCGDGDDHHFDGDDRDGDDRHRDD
jgi:hypothetical protein